MHKLFDCPPQLDLSEFTRFLWQQRIGHRILQRGGRQELWLTDPEDGPRVAAAFDRWRSGELDLDRLAAGRPRGRSRLWHGLLEAPVTAGLIVTSLVASLLVGFGSNLGWLQRLSFVYFDIDRDRLIFEDWPQMLSSGEYWRLLTPIFLHFSLLHIIFNLLWTWILGRQVERLQPSWWLAVMVVVLGVISNWAQFLMTGPLFGGLSGVVFGLMAYTWLWDRLNPRRQFGLPPALMTLMAIWLVVGVSGLLERLGFGAIANTAHLVGLLGGLVCAAVALLLFRRR